MIESAKQAGGRARAVSTTDWQVDNGQHLLLGAYHSVFKLLKQLKVPLDEQLLRKPLRLHYRGLSGNHFELSAPTLPAPLHMSLAIARARGLTRTDRISALRMAVTLTLQRYRLRHDISVRDLLLRHGQSDAAIRALWEPLCLGALNTHIGQASARVFLRTLRDAFMRRRHDADLVLYRQDLSKLLVEPAIEYIQRHGGQVLTSERVLRLNIHENQLQSVTTSTGDIPCEQLILATPHAITATLCQDHRALAPVTANLKRLTHEPICTVYLQYPSETQLPQEVIGVLDGTSQWIFDRRINQLPGQMAVVISGNGPHMQLTPEALIQRVQQELAQLFPHWPAPLKSKLIREKHATFCCHVDVEQLRPEHHTNIDGLWLAGDYTNTDYPATLEGAVRSGIQCATQLLKTKRHP